MPARVAITLSNGETVERTVPVDTWLSGETRAEIQVAAEPAVARIEIDPEQLFPDIRRDNNVWERPTGN